jgi:hypothetical protein
MSDQIMTRLEHQLAKIAREHGLNRDVLKVILSDFIKALHENQVKAWRQEDGLVGQVYWALGDETTYHLFGLISQICPGDAINDFWTELQYLDPRLKRFNKLLEMWEQERECEIKDSE